MSGQIVRVRASSWGALFDCAHRWEAEQVMGMYRPSSLRAQLGTAIHEATAYFDQAIIDGLEPDPGEAVQRFIDGLHDPEADVDYAGDDLTVREAEKIGVRLVALYCLDIAPQMTFEAVELSLPDVYVKVGNITIQLTGQMDRSRIINVGDKPVIVDVKSGRAVVSKGVAVIKGRSAQLGCYQIQYEAGTGRETGGAQIAALSTTKNPEAALSDVFDAKRVMTGDEDSKGMIEYAGHMFESGMFPPNPNSPMCSQKYCARWAKCKFHE